ncbi:hypothetical protein PGT21_009963 [Puccinia graminis f. sp. tritici]|uniref:Uncharacterized protein n=1 Tax=Puccinia graminis f. sp. tritici TaxID=56615 RepID=A0A5B0QT42_PUCGR|nr:hypothetical protein PGT21_009963 [Puccinia graminis f. sp. tritici]
MSKSLVIRLPYYIQISKSVFYSLGEDHSGPSIPEEAYHIRFFTQLLGGFEGRPEIGPSQPVEASIYGNCMLKPLGSVPPSPFISVHLPGTFASSRLF